MIQSKKIIIWDEEMKLKRKEKYKLLIEIDRKYIFLFKNIFQLCFNTKILKNQDLNVYKKG